ncbi:50S ribosomal protein L30 [Moorella thermoacetica]|uniref:Large ribosomal subunit protein uL30 n=3 Tax=Neomoorella thermoacetica TaxID=1525 RepID=RL30_MOOTA|nr:50S ribosomal protein L30 [Moorella thermoacetica]Q2RFR5.1 RecName: Full=Large ribosomal subunit protein uL30; AltName: Full=50S ribosomal protein L30 [Moorella thermoacetica ATCC 39073]AKX95302.1 50S ribosomal protein L30 [Moorella thermoacetica]AKX97927.1 50S ribosomal protein L30 [Moorella thermoacetica]OIQ10106.1 50S ribosomal protein L30 [Moorella thermoacetica]OIQ12156.1 50S ribosomal protein L30 [Moorella thermoacetica]OIQ56758.1 50S ribosomal protein L30 [Moorella thermoacetica]
MANLRITLVKSLIGRPETERKTARAMGLKKLHRQVVCPDTPVTRGQVQKLAHLVRVESIE